MMYSNCRIPFYLICWTVACGSALINALAVSGEEYEVKISGVMNGDFFLFDEQYQPVTETPFAAGESFELSFGFDDSVPRNFSLSNGAVYEDSATNVVLSISSEITVSADSATVSEFVNGSSQGNHQWSVSLSKESPGFSGGGIDTFLRVENSVTRELDDVHFSSLSLFLLDRDSSLYNELPPELIVAPANAFESAFVDIQYIGSNVQGATTGQVTTIEISRLSPLEADIDGDGHVGFTDFVILSNTFGFSGPMPRVNGDIDRNGAVGFSDFVSLANDFGEKVSVVHAPEPAPWGMVVMGFSMAVVFCRLNDQKSQAPKGKCQTNHNQQTANDLNKAARPGAFPI